MTKKLRYLLIFVLTINSVSGQTSFYGQLADSALVLTNQEVKYDPSYFRLDYPNGDVPADKGVCTDVIIRAYRKIGIDLQKEVHIDMKSNFDKYPNIWGLNQTDPNIDHRRVPNLMAFFTRHGTVLNITQDPKNYHAGDIVCWNLGGGTTHIGIVSEKKQSNAPRPLIVQLQNNRTLPI
jgi:hypothetical protein